MRYSRVIKIKHAWRAGELLACQSTRVFERWCRGARGLIARSQKSRGALKRKRGKRPQSEFKSLRVWYAAAYLVSSDLTAYLVEEVVQFFLRYLGLHPAGILRGRTSPTSLYLAEETEQDEESWRRARWARRWTPFPLRFFKCHEPSLFLLVSAVALETRRSFLDA